MVVDSVLFPRKYFKIFWTIVQFNAVFVMNKLMGLELSPKMFFHHKTVLGGVFIDSNENHLVASLVTKSALPFWTLSADKESHSRPRHSTASFKRELHCLVPFSLGSMLRLKGIESNLIF